MLSKLISTLQIWSENGSEAIKTHDSPLELPVKKDELFEALFEPHDPEFDAMTALAIEVAAAEMLILVERQAESQLAGGKYADPTPNQINIAKNVPKNNNLSERDMASLDSKLRHKPGANTETIETNIMWQTNKTSLWLDSLSVEEKSKALNLARQKAQALRNKIKSRHLALKEEIKSRLIKKQQEKEQKEQKQIDQKVKIAQEIQSVGGLWTMDNLETQLKNIASTAKNSEKSQQDALILQLKFHKNVLGVKADKLLFQASSKGKVYSVDTLKANLLQILHLEMNGMPEPNKTLVYRDMEEVENDLKTRKSNLYDTLKTARKKRQSKRQKDSLLPTLLNDPKSLVGKSVLHQCAEDGIIDWFQGKVTGIVKTHKDPLKIKYSIEYEVEDFENSWEFCLLKDLEKQDLIVIM